MALSTQKNANVKLPQISSLPNLRVICVHSNTDEPVAAIYRSSKPDRISADDIAEFRTLGIKSIIDFRSLGEYRGTDGQCTLDKEYSIYKVVLPSKKYAPEEPVQSELIVKSDEEKNHAANPSNTRLEKKHFFINFFHTNFVLTLVRRLPWHLFIWGMLHFMYDIITRNKFKTFIQFFIKHTVNTGGIVGQYIDIVDLSGVSICAALKLASNPDNMPVLINCAHGKDRTGIMSALILTCLGMPPEYVAQEYSMSVEGLKPIYHLVREDIVVRLKMKEEFAGAQARTMLQLLDYIKKNYGSVEDYMVSIGFSLAEQKTLKENLMAFQQQHIHDRKYQAESDHGGNTDTDGFDDMEVLLPENSASS